MDEMGIVNTEWTSNPPECGSSVGGKVHCILVTADSAANDNFITFLFIKISWHCIAVKRFLPLGFLVQTSTNR
jgi:hypothetical protein